MNFDSGNRVAEIYLDKSQGDLEAMYNILAYYRLNNYYKRNLACGDDGAMLCEKLFQDVRKALEDV